jgi:hypothetical protein
VCGVEPNDQLRGAESTRMLMRAPSLPYANIAKNRQLLRLAVFCSAIYLLLVSEARLIYPGTKDEEEPVLGDTSISKEVLHLDRIQVEYSPLPVIKRMAGKKPTQADSATASRNYHVISGLPVRRTDLLRVARLGANPQAQ